MPLQPQSALPFLNNSETNVSFPDTTQAGTEFPITVINGSEISLRYPASEAQLEVWLSSEQSEEANCAYNEISSLNFVGVLNVTALEDAFSKLIQRHESLRTVVSENGRDMVVRESLDLSITKLDFSSCTAIECREKLKRVVSDQGHQPFDLITGPLIRTTLQKISDVEHRLTVTAHHLVLDGWSLAVLCQDLGYFYDVACGEKRDSLPPANRYSEYAKKTAEYFDSENGRRDEEFWVNQFEDQIPVLDLPTTKVRPALRTYRADRYDHRLPADLVERLRLVGAKRGCSLFNSLLAAFSGYLSRIVGNDDFCLGIPTAGQAAMDQPELVGHCVNTMPLRSRVDSSQSFVELVKARRSDLLNAFEHQKYSYGTLLRKLAAPRDPSRPAMLSVSFNVDPMINVASLGFVGLDASLTIEPRAFENFEWFVNGVIFDDKSIELQVQYNLDLYSEEALHFYLEGFETFLEQIVTDPTIPICNLNLMSIKQRQQLVVDFNNTSLEYPANSTLHDEFARQAKATPMAVAIKFGDVELTYEQVDKQSNQIARHLRNQGIGSGDLVGICVNRSEQMLVYLYGILKAGAGYVPLDPGYPTDRLQYMCDHSALKLVVTEKELLDQVKKFNKPSLVIDPGSRQIANLSDAEVLADVRPSEICYVIYTSGSTGKPKGVQVPHGSVLNFLHSMQSKPGFHGEGESILAVTTLSFDIAVLELYLPTIFGGKTVIVDSETAADGTKLAAQLLENQISLMQATPATWRLMIQSGWTGKSDLKVLCGGEPMPQDLVEPLLDRCDELWNMYGPTETTVWSAVFQIIDAKAPILIGKPVGNTQIYILDESKNEVPVGCEGEIYIGGAGVTLGYRHRDDLTTERFVDNRYRNPFSNYVSDQLYKTGDLGKYRLDGNIQFLRRNDKQVKVRGFRIELEEIESVIQSLASVQQNVVVVREDTPGDSRLVAYVISKEDPEISATQLKDHVRLSLPYYMVPQHVVFLNEMPATNNGKIDYQALPAPNGESTNCDQQLVLPQTPAEKYLAGVWADILETDRIGVNDVFFDIGGHSLLVMQVIAAVKDRTGVRLGPQEFLICTLEQMASQLKLDETEVPQSQTNTIDRSNLDTSPARDTETVIPESSTPQSLIRKLKGFWN